MYSLKRGATSVSDATRKLFADLIRLSFGAGKPDEQENLLDILELVAVHCGEKPAHLQGKGQHDDATLDAIEALALRHGLIARRTVPMPTWTHRAPRIDPGYAAWQAANERTGGPGVLWVYRDPALASRIDDVLTGSRRAGEVLGYPECCEMQHSEKSLRLTEGLERGLREQHGATNTEDLIRFSIEDRGVQLDLDPSEGMAESMAAFPFVQFFACANCVGTAGSPAAKVNAAMRSLAFALDPALASSITASGWSGALPP